MLIEYVRSAGVSAALTFWEKSSRAREGGIESENVLYIIQNINNKYIYIRLYLRMIVYIYIYGCRRAVTTMMSFVWETGVLRIKFAGGVHYWSHLRQRWQFSCDCYIIVSIIIYVYLHLQYYYQWGWSLVFIVNQKIL